MLAGNWEGSLAANIEGEIVEFAYNKLTSGYFAWRKQSSHPNREIDDAAVDLDLESCCLDGGVLCAAEKKTPMKF